MKVRIRLEACIASGSCVLECPEVFDQDADGLAVLLMENPPKDLEHKVKVAADSCPTACIDLIDE